MIVLYPTCRTRQFDTARCLPGEVGKPCRGFEEVGQVCLAVDGDELKKTCLPCNIGYLPAWLQWIRRALFATVINESHNRWGCKNDKKGLLLSCVYKNALMRHISGFLSTVGLLLFHGH